MHLWLIRHGKSEAGTYDQRDHDRELAPRGHRDGAMLKTWFAEHENAPSWVWSSTATRAMQTARYVVEACNATLAETAELYLSSAHTIVDTLRTTPEDVSSVALVAHNPGLTQLTNLLAGDHVTENLVTFGCALFRVEASWVDLQTTGTTNLIKVTTPKGLKAHLKHRA